MATLLAAKPGARNNRLRWASCRAVEMITAGQLDRATAVGALTRAGEAVGLGPAGKTSLARWRAQLPAISPDGGLAAADRDGIRLLCPGDPGWPPGLDDLGTARPYALWVRGTTDLAACCEKSYR